jgi:hypothetical protein
MNTKLDLRAMAQANPIVLTGEPLSAEDCARAVGTWRGRMVNEHISSRVFAGLLNQMMRAGLPAEWQHRVAEMARDELRHGLECARVVEALGGEAVAELPALEPVPEHPDATPLEGVLRNVLSISCLSETVAVALIRAEQQEVGPPELEETLGSILADEVQHARFGWEILRELAPHLDAATKARLGEYLVIALHHLREHELAHLPNTLATSRHAADYGVCDGNDARKLFFDTVEQVIVPGLEEHGLPAGRAWKAAQHLSAGAH